MVNRYKKAYNEAFIPIIISTLSVKTYYADQLKGHHFLLWIWAKKICYSVKVPWIIWHEWNIRYSGKMSKNTYTWRLLTGCLGEGNSKAQYLYYLVFLQRLFRSTGIPKHASYLVLVLQCWYHAVKVYLELSFFLGGQQFVNGLFEQNRKL